VEVSAFFQDDKGYMWYGTNHGLARYDGVEFSIFTQNEGLYDNEITAITQINDQEIWIGHKSGKISVKYRDSIHQFNPEAGLPKETISSFYVDSQAIWYATYGEGIYYYTLGKKNRTYNLNADDGLSDNYVYDIVRDSRDIMYFATDKGISVYDPANDEFVHQISMSDGLPDNIVKRIEITDDKFLWIGMEDHGVCKYHLKKKAFSNINQWEFGSLNDFVIESSNTIWVSTARKGVIKLEFHGEEIPWHTKFDKNSGLADSRTNSIFKDREGNIWIGTDQGASIRKNNNFEFLNQQVGFTIHHIFNIIIDDNGHYWVASQEGLYQVSRNKMGMLNQKRLFNEPEYERCSFISLYKDYQGYIWAGTYGFGVFRINPETLDYENYSSKNGLSNDNIIHITGKNGFICFSTLGGGVCRLDQKNEGGFTCYSKEEGLTSEYAYSVFVDSKMNEWVATNGGGVSIHKQDTIVPFEENDNEHFSKNIYTIIEDGLGHIWMNSAEKGLFVYDGDTLYNYNEMNGLRTNSVRGLTTDKDGNVVIISNMGISVYDIKDSAFTYYGEAEGVAYLEPNLNAVYKDSLDNLWIGVEDGAIKINAKDTTSAKILPKIFITRKSAFFEEIEPGKNEFKYNNNHLSFNYTAIWFKSSNSLSYRYKLKGFDIDWNAETTSRMVTYSNLPPADYEFLVQVNYNEGDWAGSEDATYAFTIKPPFWKTAWFIITAIIVMILGIYLFIQLRLRNLKKAKDLLEEEVKNRTREIRKQKEEIESQRDEIEAQRNHVFNQMTQIEKQNKDITASIQYASRIQKAMLPGNINYQNYFREHFIYLLPRNIVSGDFYYMNKKKDNLIIAAADCTGHGVPGAFMSVLGISLLNQVITQLPDTLNAGEILTELTIEVKKALRQSGRAAERKDGMDMALCILNPHKQAIHFSGAFNSLFIVRNGEIIRYKGDRMPVGIYINEKGEFTNHEIEVRKNDMLYLFSDGYPDQIGGEKKHKYLMKNLRTLFLEISEYDAARQKEALQKTFESWKGKESQVDDVLVMGFRI